MNNPFDTDEFIEEITLPLIKYLYKKNELITTLESEHVSAGLAICGK